jgi:hypothetical protein
MKLAAIAGVVLAIALTAAIWFQVVDRQATATLGGAGTATGTPSSGDAPGSYGAAGDGAEPSPIP